MTIYLAGNYIKYTQFLGHLQIVYGTKETEVQAPGAVFLGSWRVKINSDHEINELDFNDPNMYAKTALNLGGRSSSDVWSVINDAAQDISGYTIPYDMAYNSNTFAVTLLNIVGVTTSLPYPGNVSWYPGSGSLLSTGYFNAYGIKYDIKGTSGNDIINGQGYNDTIRNLGFGQDSVSGGAGNDTFYYEGQDRLTIRDSDAGDKIIAKGITLKGPLIPKEDCPEDQEPDEEPYENEDGVLGADGERYKLSGGDVVVTLKAGEKITVEQFTQGDFGWEFYEGDREVAIYNGAACFRDPIVIDLDGDGVEFTALEAGKSFFDYDNDGFGERTAWASSDDGLLAVDLDGDGKITTAAELFAEEPTVGFDALAAYDSNGDGTINADDAGYADLRIWQDANSDGITDDGELRALAEAGIAIGLNVDFHDPSSTKLGLSLTQDTNRDDQIWRIEFDRRLTDSTTMNVQAQIFDAIDPAGVLTDLGGDSHLQISFTHRF